MSQLNASSRIQTIDSLELGLSSFAVDLSQMSVALRCANESSLVLVPIL
jgi:DNA mismatch repair ATPase MutS